MAEGARLEIALVVTSCHVGSNPTLSAGECYGGVMKPLSFGRARRGVSGVLNPKAAIAGLNSRLRVQDSGWVRIG